MMNKENRYWILFGKISAVVVFLSAIVAIYIQVFPSRSDLKVEGYNYEQYSLPVDVIDNIHEYKAKTGKDSIEKYISEYDTIYNLQPMNRLLLSYYLYGKLGKIWDYYPYDVNEYHNSSFFIIKNQGTKPSEDISFRLPCSGIALISEENGKQTTYKFTKEIKLKELRPEQIIKVTIWTQSISWYNEDEFKISDKDGVGSVSLFIEVDGLAKFISKYLPVIRDMIVFIISPFILVILISYFSYKKKQSVKNQPDDVHSEHNGN